MKNLQTIAAVVMALWMGIAAASEPSKWLTLQQAHDLAIYHHPRITIAQLKTMVAQQQIIAARAAYYPQVSGNVSAVGNSDELHRISNPNLTTSSAQDRVTVGVGVTQLLTDFGRTASLTESSALRAAAEEQNAIATRADLLLQVDTAYFAALQAQSVLRIAQETVKTRQLILNQVAALAEQKLKSELDVSFAEVNLQEANLLDVKAQNDVKAAVVVLATLMGSPEDQDFGLVEEVMPFNLTEDLPSLIEESLVNRPELNSLRHECIAAQKKADAERSLRYPTVNALAAVGDNPAHSILLNEYYVVGGVAMTMTLRDGHRIDSQITEAELKASQLRAAFRNQEINIRRDVQVALLNVHNAQKQLEIAGKLLEYSSRSFDLAQARYKVGASSIIELSQSQLNVTAAAITQAGAKYDYLARRAALDFQVGRVR